MARGRKQADEIIASSGGIDDILGAVRKDITKEFEVAEVREVAREFLSTGLPAVNFAFSGRPDGGFPVGYISELAGLSSSGKSLLAQHALVETQKKNGVAILVDSEYAFNPDWYRVLGGTPEKLIHFEPDYIEQSYDFMERTVLAIRERDLNIPITIVYDSVAASPSKKEFESTQEAHDMGKRAIAHGKGIRMLMGLTKKNNVTFIAINQFRKTMAMYGPDMDTTGGMAWDYACSLRVKMKKGKKIVQKRSGVEIPLGISGSLQVTKSRIAAPFAEAEFDIYFDNGMDPTSGLMDVYIKNGTFTQSGQGWWEYEGEKFQKSKFKEILAKYPVLLGGHELIDIPEDTVVEAIGSDGEDAEQ